MAIQTPRKFPRFARDLDANPAKCEVGDDACPPATMVLELVVPISVTAAGRMFYLTCDRIGCLNTAQVLGDSYRPSDTDLRDATVAELEELSGLDVTGVIAGAA